MATTVERITRPSLWIDLQADKDATKIKEMFRGDGGVLIVGDLLRRAGLHHGRWTFRLITAYSTSSKTPRIQIRGVDPHGHGVRINLRPGVPASAVKGILFVTKDREFTVEQVCTKLRAAVEQIEQEAHHRDERRISPAPTTPMVPAVPIEEDEVIGDSETELILMAVQELTTKGAVSLSPQGYFELLKEALGDGYTRPMDILQEIVDLLVEDKLLVDRGDYFTVSPTGEEFLNPKPMLLEDEPPPALMPYMPSNGSLASPTPTPPPLISQPPTDIATLLMRSKSRLLALAQLGDNVTACRNRQKSIRDKIASLHKDLTAEEATEHSLTASLDVEALTKLLGGG